MNEDVLMRLVDALETVSVSLERIAGSLEHIEEQFDECISRGPGKNAFLCVTGNVTNY